MKVAQKCNAIVTSLLPFGDCIHAFIRLNLKQDVTARGIDVPMVDLVVQFSAPHKIADYVHRVGRTARAGRSGNALLFLGPHEVEFIRMLESKRIR